jgi:hypothetical protein
MAWTSSFRLIDGDIFDSCTRTEIYATHITWSSRYVAAVLMN